jgi:hypothetical protein
MGGHLAPMSTLAEIEAAIAQLPPTQWMEIRRWMDANVPKAATTEALKVFRQLQEEIRLTAEGAAVWKDAVADARR